MHAAEVGLLLHVLFAVAGSAVVAAPHAQSHLVPGTDVQQPHW